MTVEICSVDDVKEYLSIGVDEDEDDDLLARIVNAANEYIEHQTGRIFEDPGVDATRYFRRANISTNGTLWFDEDLLSLTTLTNGDAAEITSGNYELLPYNITPKRAVRILDSSSFYWSFDYNDSKIAVTGRWAYSATVPYTAQQAAIRLASYIYRQKDNSADIDRPVLAGDGNIIMPAKMPKDVTEFIDSMRLTFV